MQPHNVGFLIWSRLFASVEETDHAPLEFEVIDERSALSAAGLHRDPPIPVGLARGANLLDIFRLDVSLADFAVLFPAADVVGAELLAVVVAVVGVEPTAERG